MLRLINAALNDELFFAIDGHTLTVVEADAAYVKPFSTRSGHHDRPRPDHHRPPCHPPDRSRPPNLRPRRPPLRHRNRSSLRQLHRDRLHPLLQIHPTRLLPSSHPPPKPPRATRHHLRHRLLRQAPEPRLCRVVPKEVNKEVFLTISLNLQDCCSNCTCKGPDSKRFAASMNNQSFVRPPISMLQSYYSRNSTLLEDFPERPAKVAAGTNMNAEYGARLLAVAYGARMEVVLQDTSFINAENHPIHVHGHNFFVVGRGFGNFERERDRKRYNLEDPPERNTVAAPSGGWAAIRLTADNPGVWFVHSHLEVHTTWGLAVGFVAENAPGESQSILPPPDDLPRC